MSCGALYDGSEHIKYESRTSSTEDDPVEEKDGHFGSATKGQNSERAGL